MQHSDLRMTRRALMAAASAGLLAAPARAATEWQLFTSQNRTAPIALGVLERLLAEAPARTNNALTIELKTAGTLPIRSTAVADAVAAGKVQLGDDTYFPAVLPPGGMLRMPGLVLNADELQEVLPIQQEYLTAAFAKLKIVVLGYYVSAPQIIFSSRKVLSIEDLRGLVVRTTTSEQSQAVLRLGGVAVSMTPSELTAALEAGTVQGVFGTPAIVGRQWKERLTFASRITPVLSDGVILGNRAALAALPETVRAAVTKLGADIAAEITNGRIADNDAAMKELVAGGLRIVDPLPDDIAAATRRLTPFWEAMAGARGKDGNDILAAMRLALGR